MIYSRLFAYGFIVSLFMWPLLMLFLCEYCFYRIYDGLGVRWTFCLLNLKGILMKLCLMDQFFTLIYYNLFWLIIIARCTFTGLKILFHLNWSKNFQNWSTLKNRNVDNPNLKIKQFKNTKIWVLNIWWFNHWGHWHLHVYTTKQKNYIIIVKDLFHRCVMVSLFYFSFFTQTQPLKCI